MDQESNMVETLQTPPVSPGPNQVTARPAHAAALRSYAIFVAILSLLFSRSLVALAGYALHSTLDSYILLVPVIAVYLMRPRLRTTPVSPERSIAGTTLFLVAACSALALLWSHGIFGWPGGENDQLTAAAFAYVSLVVAGGFFFVGSRWMSAMAFPIAFLYFLVPLPEAAVTFLENASQAASAEAADLFFSVSAMPVLRDGYIFQMPGITIRVAQECSGIHSSLVLFIASLLCAQLFLKSPWRRALLILFIFPLGIVRNGFRIFVIGWLCTHVGPHMIHHPIHHRGGPVFFVLSLIPLFFILRWLWRGEMEHPRPAPTA